MVVGADSGPVYSGPVDGRGTRVLIAISSIVVVVMVAVYLSLIRAQGGTAPDWLTVPFVTAYLLTAAALLVASLLRMGTGVRAAMRAAGAAGLLVLGYLAGFSIGVPLILAGVLAAIATLGTMSHVRGVAIAAAPAAAVIAVAVLIGGFEVSERAITCPATGSMSGSGTGFVTGPYHWSCAGGTLHWSSGAGSTSGSASG